MKVLITGAAGMLGSSLMRNFSLNSTNFEAIGWTRSEVDLSSRSAVLQKLEACQPDLVIHAAAKVGGIQANMNEPLGFLAQNLEIDRNIILSSLSLGISRLIYVGSSCMYPRNYRQPLRESDILRGALEPTNEGYALAKIVGAKLCEFASKEEGVFFRTIIPSNLYGPGDNFNPTSSHLLASVIRKVHEAKVTGRKVINVWGSGKARREFTYIEDVSDWLVNSVSQIDKFPQYLNVGYGNDYSVDEFYLAALKVIGVDAELEHDFSKPDGMLSKLMDSSLARQRVRWNPKTDLFEGLEKTYSWYLKK